MQKMVPKTKILPDAQKEPWPLLKYVPDHFVLYGGTAVALRYGHRQSIDFDFFSTKRTLLLADSLSSTLPFLHQFGTGVAEKHFADQTGQFISYKLSMSNKANVDISFVESEVSIPGALKAPDVAIGNKIMIASADDLMATKIHTLGKRVALKDYIDVKEMIKHGVSLSKGFAAAMRFRGGHLAKDFSVFEIMCETLQNPSQLKYRLDFDKGATTSLREHIPEILEILPSAARRIDLKDERENSKSIHLSSDLTCGVRRDSKCQER